MCSICDKSNEVCQRVVQAGFHADMFYNLTWDTLSVDSLNNSQSEEKRLFVAAHVCTLHIVVSRTESARSAYRQCQAIDVMQKFRGVQIPVIKKYYVLFNSRHMMRHRIS